MKLFTLVTALIVLPATQLAAQSVDFRNDPRAEAELLSIEITDALRPTAALADRIQGGLAAIRSAYPIVADIRMFAPWQPGAVEVQLNPTAYNAYRNGTFTGFDALYSDLGTPTADLSFLNSSMRFLVLSFGKVYHGERLADLFHAVDGVENAYPEGFVGDGDDIVARSDRTYTLSNGYGDCPAGCIFRDAWTFSVTDGGVTLVGQADTGGGKTTFKIDPPANLPEPTTMVQCVCSVAAWLGFTGRRRRPLSRCVGE